jgi:hypothetical protein
MHSGASYCHSENCDGYNDDPRANGYWKGELEEQLAELQSKLAAAEARIAELEGMFKDGAEINNNIIHSTEGRPCAQCVSYDVAMMEAENKPCKDWPCMTKWKGRK